MTVDPNIKKKADDIRNKIYGKEVRESLASGLEEMSSDVVENEGRQSVVEIRQDNVESQFQDVIENTTDKDVISAPEIIAARNGESNLKARLDKENQEVTAQLAQTERLNLIDITDPPKPLDAVVPDGVSDNRQAIQTIIDFAKNNNYKGIYIPVSAQPFMINVNHIGTTGHRDHGLKIPSDFKFIMDTNTVLKALPTTHSYHAMINVYDSKRVEIRGGTIIGERDSHGSEVNQFGYGLYIGGSEDVTVKNMISKDWWGDCFVTRDIDHKPENNFLQPCRNIVFENVIADNGCRQGLSIISGKGVKVLDSTFMNTNGTAPESGIDIEPNYNDEVKRVENVLIKNCKFSNNAQFSIVASNSENVVIEGNTFVNDGNCTLLDSTINSKVINNTFTDTKLNIGNSWGIEVSGNIIKGASGSLGLGGSSEGFNVYSGNYITDVDRGVSNTPNSKNIIFTKNVISNCQECFYIIEVAENVFFTNNKISNSSGMNTINLKNSVLSNNVFDDHTYAIRVLGGGDVNIDNNTFNAGDRNNVNDACITVSSAVEGVTILNNVFHYDNTDQGEVIKITANAERTKKIIVRNNTSYKTSNLFDAPPAGVVSENNYSS